LKNFGALKVMNSQNKQERLKQVFNVLVGNFLKTERFIKIDELLSEIAHNSSQTSNYFSSQLNHNAECTFWNLYLINCEFIIRNLKSYH
jgi:hypothetical protein